jgi:propanediol dehydratase small subunit
MPARRGSRRAGGLVADVGAGPERPRYPLAARRDSVHSASGLAVADLALEQVAAGEIGPDDVRISPDTLRFQATFAEEGGNPQLAENLRRGAELCAFDDEELLHFYETLRPGRASAAEMDELAEQLAARGAERCAALVREARGAYVRRGVVPTS